MKHDEQYLKMARVWATNSKSQRMKVGCLVVKNEAIISDGYNGSPKGMDNNCEDDEGNTLPHVLHAEANAITKLAKSTQSSIGATLYTTVSPCIECAKMIIQCEIDRVVYINEYRKPDGLELLKKAGIKLKHYEHIGKS